MATVSSSDPLAVAAWDHGSESKSDRYLAARLAAAGADFKSVAVATFVLGAAVAAASWLALGVLAEHWIVPGGLPVEARWAWLVAGVAAFVAATVRWAVPLVRYRVNLVYAARAIEHEHPELHNDIVNAVLVKAHAEDSTPLVVRSLERRAAKRLSVVPADGVADRDVPLRLSVALAALVAALGVYQLLAPKSLVVSAARLVAPWWGLAAPARVSIASPRLAWRMPPDGAGGDRPVQPLEAAGGTVTLVRGRQLVVETDVEGLRGGERAMVVVTPLRDGGSADGSAPWQIPLVGGPQPGRLTAVLPDAARGLEHSVEFVVAAGDARTERLRVAVVDTPTLLVREVRYDYPAYTGRRPETVAWQGDLRAPEFTKVTVTAECNRPLEAAWIDPGCGGRDSERKRMRIGQHDLARASGEFPLRLNGERTAPEFASYRLGFQPRSAAGGGEPPIVEKLEHRVEVIADVAPEVSIEAPEDAIRVPPSAPVAIRVRALDPDYGLARVGIEARVRGGAERPPDWMLERTHSGPFVGSIEIVPEQLGAGAGAVLEYRAIAVDTRPEKPNVSHSPWRSLQIDAAAQPPLDRQPPAGAGGEGDGMQAGRGARGDDPQDGLGTAGENRPDRPSAGTGAGERESQGDAAAQDRAGAQGGGPEGGDRRDDAGAGQDQPQRRDNGGRQQADERPEQSGQQGGESNAGAGAQPKPEQSGSGTGGKPQAGGGTSDRGQGAAEGKKPGGPQEGSGKQERGDASRDGKGTRDGAGQQAGPGRPQGDRERRGGEQAEGRGASRSPPRNAVAADGTNDGEAMERILANRRRQEAAQKGTQPERGEASEQRPGADGAPQRTDRGEKPSDGGKTKEGDAQQQPAPCPGADGKPCGKEGCSTCNGGGKAGGSSGAGSGEGKSGEGKSGEGKSGEGKSGEGKSGEGKSGEGKSGEGKSGEGKSGEGKSGEGKSGEGKSGEGKSGEGKSGEGKSGEGKSGEGKSGEGKSGEGKSGEGKSGEGATQRTDRGEKSSGGGTPKEGDAQQQPSTCPGADGKPCGKEGCSTCNGGGKAGGSSGAGSGEGKSGEGKGRDGQAQPGNGQPGGVPSGERGQPGSKPGGDLPEGPQPAPGSQVGAGGRAGGDRGGSPAGPADAAPPRRDAEWTEQDTTHARNAADLAVEHLRDNLNAGRTDVLDELGWTPEQARAFIDRWQAMRRLAGSADARDRGEFEHAIRSLGLRPDGVRTARDVPADARGGQAEGRRSRPPAAYREQVEAYLRGAGGE